jgi:cobalt-zinc-cadmium efflux system membrane fusion protein
MRRAIAPIGLLLSMAGLVCACTSNEAAKGVDEHGEDRQAHSEHEETKSHDESVIELHPQAAARMDIRVAPVEQRVLAGVLSTTGRVDFDQDRLAHVAPRVPGRVDKVLATLGDHVEAGQTLAIIDSIELGRAKSAFLRAKVQLELARKTLAREESLLADRITSEQAVLEARSAYEGALATYETARQELRLLGLSERDIRRTTTNDPKAAMFPLPSPLAGTVVEKHVSLGEVVSSERNLFTVADLSEVWIWIDVYERNLARVHLEDEVVVKVEAFPDQTFEGKVAYIRNQVDPGTRTARARVDVPNLQGHLRPGMFASVTVTDPHGQEGHRASETLVVPSNAVQRDGPDQVVFVPLGDDRYERRVVTIGRRTDTLVEVLDGVSADESVVVEGTFLLKSEAAKSRMGGGDSH